MAASDKGCLIGLITVWSHGRVVRMQDTGLVVESGGTLLLPYTPLGVIVNDNK